MNDEPIEVKTQTVYQNLFSIARGHFHFSKKLLQTEIPPCGAMGILVSYPLFSRLARVVKLADTHA